MQCPPSSWPFWRQTLKSRPGDAPYAEGRHGIFCLLPSLQLATRGQQENDDAEQESRLRPNCNRRSVVAVLALLVLPFRRQRQFECLLSRAVFSSPPVPRTTEGTLCGCDSCGLI